MFKPYFFITKLNLMKKTVLRTNVLLCSIVFFFVGMASINAQYVSPDEAIILLKAEIEELEADALNATPAQAHEIAFQYIYFRAIAYDINDGSEVGAAIENNQPSYKGVYQAPGLTYFVSDNSFKSSLAEALNAAEALLSD